MWNEFYAALPLFLISAAAIGTMLIDALMAKSQKATFVFSTVALGVIALAAAFAFSANGTAFNEMITTGGYASFFDILFALGGVMTLLSAHPYLKRNQFEFDEFYSMVLFAVSGMMLIAHANNMLIVFIGIEVMSVSFYVLAGYLRNSVLSVEAALKYFLLGAFATGFLLYGMALVYGATGSLGFYEIAESARSGSEFPLLMLIGVGLLVIGLSFKVAAFPFHFWVPDVYQGAPTVVTAFMSTAGKAAAFSAFIPIMIALMPANAAKIQLLLAVIAAASMLVGNISAVVQSNVKRMLAYSSVAHAGYIMMGLVANSPRGMSGIMYYVAAYLFMQVGAFVVVSVLESKAGKNLEIEDYIGLGKSHPLLAALMTIFMFSLAGIPPFAGFFGKYYLFTAAIESGFTWLTIVGVVSSVISVYFYIGLIVAMYFRDSDEKPVFEAPTGLAGITLIVATVGVFVIGLLPVLIANVTDSLRLVGLSF